MKLEDFIMLKNIDVSKYFEMFKIKMELDDNLWKRRTFLNNIKEGFEIFKCTRSKTCNNHAVAITKIALLNYFYY